MTPIGPHQHRVPQAPSAWMDGEDERFNIPRPNVEELARKLAPKAGRAPGEGKRLGFYLLSGAVGLAMLLMLADGMNPPDSELEGQAPGSGRAVADPSGPLAAWEGTWFGRLTRYDLAGRPMEAFDVTREYTSTGPGVQTLTVVRRADSGDVTTEVWVATATESGQLFAECFGEYHGAGGSSLPDYTGRLEGSHLIWTGQRDQEVVTLRSRVQGNAMIVEELVTGSQTGSMVSGILSRR